MKKKNIHMCTPYSHSLPFQGASSDIKDLLPRPPDHTLPLCMTVRQKFSKSSPIHMFLEVVNAGRRCPIEGGDCVKFVESAKIRSGYTCET